jgi:hypothetical protein
LRLRQCFRVRATFTPSPDAIPITRANDLLNVYAKHLNDPDLTIDEYSLIEHLRRTTNLADWIEIDPLVADSMTVDCTHDVADLRLGARCEWERVKPAFN